MFGNKVAKAAKVAMVAEVAMVAVLGRHPRACDGDGWMARGHGEAVARRGGARVGPTRTAYWEIPNIMYSFCFLP